MMNRKYRPESASEFLGQVEETTGHRAGAIKTLAERGIPTPKLERWKYTNLLAFEQSGAVPAHKIKLVGDITKLPWMVQSSRKLIFVNGFLALGDVRLTHEGDHGIDTPSRFDDTMLWDLNALFNDDGPCLRLGTEQDGQTFEIIHVAQGEEWDKPTLSSPRSLIDITGGAKITIIEQFIGNEKNAVHTNHVAKITLGEGTRLDHIRVQAEFHDRTHLSSSHVCVAKDAKYNQTFLTVGAATSRNEIWAEILGSGADCTIRGAQLAAGRQHMDTTIHIDHKAQGSTSNQVIKNLLTGKGRGVFQGKVCVDRIAQQTDAYQLCNTIMLSDTCEMNTKPELEIYADDVKCSHGTTTGALDEDPLFYLRSRGIDEASAKRLMLMAFVSVVFDELDENLRTPLMNAVEGWLDYGLKSA